MGKVLQNPAKPMDIDAILGIIRLQLPVMRQLFHVGEIGVFGSFARREQRAHSDLDVLVEFRSPPDLFGLMDLQSLLRSMTGRRIDLVSRGALRGRVGQKVLREVVWA